MLQFLLDGAFAPFTLALALLTGLMVLELVALLLGGSLIGADSDADLDIDAGDVGDFDLDLDGAELGGVEGIDAADLDLPDAELDLELAPDAPADAGVSNPTGLASWLGLGRMPTVIWLGAILLGFGLSGMGLQVALSSLFGLLAPAWGAAIPAGAFAFWFARVFGLRLPASCHRPKPRHCPSAIWAAAAVLSPKAPPPGGARLRCESWMAMAMPTTCAPNL
ncbi:hypothetical protein [Phaeobacter gallaeciensis]|uniref:hypothetical protein n=1 Tax=Phaeobacter gallaeciensis TaxID=60890 RepID=UPI003158BFD1